MKKIKIAFVDFWEGFNPKENYFITVLQKFYEIEWSDDPQKTEYLFYSCFGYQHMKYSCIKIFYTGENIVPDFNLCDYAIGYEHLQYGDRYIRMPLYTIDFRKDYFHMMESWGKITERKRFCSFVASNNVEADSARKDLFEKLSEYQQVDAGGRFLNNIGLENGVEDKQQFQEQYKFSMAVENSSHLGYCTEKIVQAFAAGTIPIYWGDPAVGTYFNEKAFVNCHKYKNFDEVLEVVKRIDQNEEIYRDMLRQSPITDEKQTIEAYDKAFEQWLTHMIDQPQSRAYRRSRYGKELVYTRQIKEWLFCEKQYREFARKSRIKKVAHVLLKHF